jgi:drug/metabolite transporter (DMT)-like permease
MAGTEISPAESTSPFAGGWLVHTKLLLVVAIWGLGWTAGREVATGMPEAFAAWLRYAMAVPLFFIWIIWKEGDLSQKATGKRLFVPQGEDFKDIAIMAVFATVLYQLFFMYGMARTAAGDASVIITFNPGFTSLIAILLIGRRMTSRLAIGLLLGLAGVAIVTGWSPNTDIPADQRILGDILIMFAAASWALSTNIMKRILERNPSESRLAVTPLSIIVWTSFLGWLMLTPFALYDLWMVGSEAMPNKTEFLWLAYLAVFSTMFSYVWFADGVDKIGPTAAATYVYLVPFFGILSGWLLLSESIGWSLAVGLGLILVGVQMAQSESNEASEDSNAVSLG